MKSREEQAIFIMEKIAKWDPEGRNMSYEQSFKCCQGMAQVFLRSISENTTKSGNIIKTDRFQKK